MDDFENDIFGGVTTDDITGAVNDPNYDSNWAPVEGVDDQNYSNTSWSSLFGDNIFSRFLSGTASGQDKALATLGFGIASLASALRNKPPEVKMPVYKEAPVYNRALTAPMLPPQPAPTKSASGQNIYQPMRGLPLFFNPNPFQFNPTEAAKRYGPTPEEQEAGWAGYQQGLERLYQTLGTQPTIQFGTGASTVTGATGNDTVAGGQSTVTGATGNDTVAGGQSTVTGGTTGITSGDSTIRPPKDAAAPLVPPPPPAPSTSSTQTTQSSGVTTQVPSTVSSNVVPEGYFRNPVQSSGSLSQIPGALNEGEFLPILKDADWYMTQDLLGRQKNPNTTWRDPISGYGIAVETKNPDDPTSQVVGFKYYDPQGRTLRSSIFNPAELYSNAEEFGIDLSGISELGKKLDPAGVSYRPGELYAGSDHGINFDDIAAKTVNPPGGASGGSIDDILVGYDGGAIGYDEGGDVYAYAKGQYLRGDGDGMSDSIEAYIEGDSTGDGQPARLARNEFVIPADVVADLGNGSSDAGAEALYEMMDRIRMARHDTKDQPPAVNVDKILPA